MSATRIGCFLWEGWPNKKELDVVSENDMKEKTFATFVPANGALYLRTESTADSLTVNAPNLRCQPNFGS